MERIKRFQKREDDLSHSKNWYKFFLWRSPLFPIGLLLYLASSGKEPLFRPKKVRVPKAAQRHREAKSGSPTPPLVPPTAKREEALIIKQVKPKERRASFQRRWSNLLSPTFWFEFLIFHIFLFPVGWLFYVIYGRESTIYRPKRVRMPDSRGKKPVLNSLK